MQFVYWIPVATTVVAGVFATIVLRRYMERRGTHLLWWGIGLVIYGIGTLTESLTTIFGWNEWVFRFWYISGALCGGAPLAQGTVYLLLKRHTAHVLAALLVTAITVGAVFVLLSPINYALVEPHRLSGRVLGWPEVRLVSPFINSYAALFLIGGAILSAARYRQDPAKRGKYVGNVLIAIGAILPGIGGTFTRFGYVEVLYVTEFVGLLLIFAGFRRNVATSEHHFSTAPEAALMSGA
jgi:multisubunit Na+/H+ antiporter MnhC subunit